MLITNVSFHLDTVEAGELIELQFNKNISEENIIKYVKRHFPEYVGLSMRVFEVDEDDIYSYLNMTSKADFLEMFNFGRWSFKNEFVEINV